MRSYAKCVLHVNILVCKFKTYGSVTIVKGPFIKHFILFIFQRKGVTKYRPPFCNTHLTIKPHRVKKHIADFVF